MNTIYPEVLDPAKVAELQATLALPDMGPAIRLLLQIPHPSNLLNFLVAMIYLTESETTTLMSLRRASDRIWGYTQFLQSLNFESDEAFRRDLERIRIIGAQARRLADISDQIQSSTPPPSAEQLPDILLEINAMPNGHFEAIKAELRSLPALHIGTIGSHTDATA